MDNAKKKIPAADWRNLPTQSWTVTSFRQFLADTHAERYGIPYVARNYAIEAKWLKAMIAEHGAETVRSFIEACFAEYKPTRDYPGLNFAFMYSYQRARILPRVLAESERRKRSAEVVKVQNPQDDEDMFDWL